MKRLRRKLTYANVVATLALFIALAGGTAYAASQLDKESVGTRQLAKEAVTPLKLSKKAKSTLVGPAGPKGAIGATGAQGLPGASGATKVDVQYGPAANGSFAHCPTGQVAVGGGGEGANQTGLFVSEPLTGSQLTPAGGTPDGWFAKAPTNQLAIAYVVCAAP